MDKNILIGKLQNGLKYYIYKDEISYNIYTYLINKCGSIEEKHDEIGISHLLEHLILESINILDCKSRVSGYTDFNEVVFRMYRPESNLINIHNMMYIINKVMNHEILNETILKKTQKMITEEYDCYKEETIIKKRIISFITNNKINDIPIGDREILNKLSFRQLVQYYRERYLPDNMAIIIISNIDVDEVEKIIHESLTFYSGRSYNRINYLNVINSNVKEPWKVDILDLKNDNKSKNIKIFHRYYNESKEIKNKLIKYLYYRVFENYVIENFKLNNIDINELILGDKELGDKYKFYSLSFNTYNHEKSIKIYNKIIQHIGFEEWNIDDEKDKLRAFLSFMKKDTINIHPEDIYNSYLYNFLYNEPIFFYETHYNLILELLEKINSQDIKKYFDKISRKYTIVIT